MLIRILWACPEVRILGVTCLGAFHYPLLMQYDSGSQVEGACCHMLSHQYSTLTTSLPSYDLVYINIVMPCYPVRVVVGSPGTGTGGVEVFL